MFKYFRSVHFLTSGLDVAGETGLGMVESKRTQRESHEQSMDKG